MNPRHLLIFCGILFCACKTNKKEVKPSEPVEPTILEQIAYAHGYEKWNKVDQISFTFNVDRDSAHLERSWVWRPTANNVTYISAIDTITYNRKNLDSVSNKINAKFINDRYWLLAPFNLIWDSTNFSHDHIVNQQAPISKKPMQKLTIVYGNEGGYTPGDAYDFFFTNDFLIKEWVFRKGNQDEPSMVTTWENHLDLKGFKLARDHKMEEGNFNLYFDGIDIKLAIN